MSIRIGFDDEVQPLYNEEEEVQELPKGVRGESEMSLDDIYVSEARLKFIVDGFEKGVVVNNYGDDYHMSEEARMKSNEYYEVFKPLKRSKRKYRKLDEWVKVMRSYMTAIQVIADNNTMYSPEKFMEKYAKGKIKIYGVTFPKYVGKDRKDINWEYVWKEFIGTDRDLSELMKPTTVIDDDIQSMRKRLFTDEEYARITRPISDEEKYRINTLIFDKDYDSVDGVNVVLHESKKVGKDFIKTFPEVAALVKESKRAEAASRGLSSFIHDMTMEDIELINRYDRKHNFTMNTSQAPVFNGKLTKKNVDKFAHDMDEYIASHRKVNYEGKMRTLDEIQEIKTKEFLDEMGYNIRKCFDNAEEEDRIKKIIRRDKKKEKRLKRRLMEVSNRNKAREQGEPVKSSKKSKKKKKKSKEDD